jgi:hypothetical protein
MTRISIRTVNHNHIDVNTIDKSRARVPAHVADSGGRYSRAIHCTQKKKNSRKLFGTVNQWRIQGGGEGGGRLPVNYVSGQAERIGIAFNEASC